MPYCPKCSAEYVEGTIKCPDCDVFLDAEPPHKKEDAPASHEMTEFVPMHAYSTRVIAEMVVESLENEGIAAMIKSNETFGLGTGLGVMAPTRIEVWVAKDDLEAATDIADNTVDPI